MARIAIEGERNDLETISDVLDTISEETVESVKLVVNTTDASGSTGGPDDETDAEATEDETESDPAAMAAAATPDGGAIVDEPEETGLTGPSEGFTQHRDKTKAWESENMMEEIAQFLDENPGTSARDVWDRVDAGNYSTVSAALSKMHNLGLTDRDGEGHRHSTYEYRLSDYGKQRLDAYLKGESRIRQSTV